MSAENQKTIILVEDEMVIAMVEKFTIEKFGYNVIMANSGEEAVDTVEKTPSIDLILMDIELGAGMDGTEAAEIILQDRDIPIVFLSAHTEPEIVAKTEKIASYGYLVKNSSNTVLQALIKIVFKLFEAKKKEKEKEPQREAALEALKAAEETYRNIFLNAQTGLFRTDMNTGLILDANDCVARFIGYKDREELLAKPFNIAERYVDIKDRKRMVALLKEHGQFNNFEARFKRNDGAIVWMRFAAKIVPEKGWIEGVSEDITKEKVAEKALQQNNQKWEAIITASPDGIGMISLDGKLQLMSDKLLVMYGYSVEQKDEIIGKTAFDFIDPSNHKMLFDNMHKLLAGKKDFNVSEYLAVKKDNSKFYVELSSSVLFDSKGDPESILFVERDITERKQAEEEIKRQLAEKEILLKEVHHRIKNNIASIGGLLSLHVQSATNPEATAVLQDAIGRVNSMRVLYDKLLLSEDYKDVSVKNYLSDLIDTVIAIFPNKAKIKIDKRIADFQLDPKRLFPLGIIINELLTNIMKYAFTNRDTGLIKISLTNVDNRVALTIQDNGIGLPDGFDINVPEGFGIKLVKMLSQQLGGSFSMEKHAGTLCIVEFNI